MDEGHRAADHGPALASVRRLRERLTALPEHLAAALGVPVSPVGGGPVVATGIGQSSGPAELLVEALRSRGSPAELRALSRFLTPRPAEAATLVVFTQRLSPNATLALARAHGFARALLVTGQPCERPGCSRVEVPCPDESGALFRLAGPLLHAATALRLAGYPPPAGVVEALRRALEPRAPDEERQSLEKSLGRSEDALPLVLVASPTLGSLSAAQAVARCWLEATGRWALPTDALELAHGPLQSIFDRPAQVLSLETRADPPGLGGRVASVLAKHHALARFTATLEPPWSAVELLARGLSQVVSELERAPRDVSRWPGQGADGALYDLAGDALPPGRPSS